MTRMFCIFNLFAQKHNIFNWISHETLLEAARHQGFIPWDVYSDIQMRLDDYVKFFSSCSEGFTTDNFFSKFN